MSKFTLKVELEDDRYCNGCNLCQYDYDALSQAETHTCRCFNMTICGFELDVTIERPSWCPLRKEQET